MADMNIAILGLGRLGYAHANNLKENVKGANLQLVVDPIVERAEQVAKELGIENWSSNPDEALSSDSIDAVVIVTPTSTHGEMIKKAAKHKKHVFVEKPLTETIEEASEVIDVVEQENIICQVGFMRRFDPAYHNAKLQIDAGHIGEPIYFKGITRDQGSPPAEFIKHSGGIFLDCSIHDYDIARYLMNSEIVNVSAHGKILNNPFMAEFNDVDQGISYVEFASGAIGDIEASRNSPYGHDIRTEIVGTEGTLMIGTLRNQNVTLLNKHGSNYDIIPDFQTRFEDAYRIELEEFIKTIQAEEKPRVTALDSKINMQIALAATDSFRNAGKNVKISLGNKGVNESDKIKL